jgi:hypothetical protein
MVGATITGDLDLAARDGAVWGAVVEVVGGVEAELEVFAARVEEGVVARVEAVQGGLSVELAGVLRRCVWAAVRDALARLRCQAELPRELPPEFVELARVLAGSGCGPPELVDAWLAGQDVFWNRFALVAERVLADLGLCWEAVKAARLQLSGYLPCLSGLFRDAWEAELADTVGVVEDGRWLAVGRALTGQRVEAAELGYDLGAHHVAVVADVAAAVEALARRSGRQVLMVAAPAGTTWGWLGGRAPMSEDELDAVVTWQRSQGEGAVAFGEPAPGMAGFAASHQQALEAHTIGAASGERVVRFAELRLLVAVLRDREVATGLVERELGPLDQAGERMQELRATLRTYLEHSQSITATAALRRRNRKTIGRQLRDAEQLIHHPISDRSDELLIALRVAEILHGHGW